MPGNRKRNRHLTGLSKTLIPVFKFCWRWGETGPLKGALAVAEEDDRSRSQISHNFDVVELLALVLRPRFFAHRRVYAVCDEFAVC